MSFLLLPPGIDRTHFLVTLLETKLASRDVEQILCFASMRSVTGQAFTSGNRFVGIFSGQHRFFIVALIAQLTCRALAHLGLFFRAVRVMASQALSLCNRVVQHLSQGIHALVARQAQPCFGFHEFEFVLAARERRMTHHALSYLKRAVQILVLDDGGMALARNAAFGRIGMLFFLGRFSPRRTHHGAQQQNHQPDLHYDLALCCFGRIVPGRRKSPSFS